MNWGRLGRPIGVCTMRPDPRGASICTCLQGAGRSPRPRGGGSGQSSCHHAGGGHRRARPNGYGIGPDANQRFVLVFLTEEPGKVVAAGTIRALERSSTRGGGRVLVPGGRKPLSRPPLPSLFSGGPEASRFLRRRRRNPPPLFFGDNKCWARSRRLAQPGLLQRVSGFVLPLRA